jgi:hypothetical protein
MSRAEQGTERPHRQLPSAQDYYHYANRCLDMWNDAVDDGARSRLLQMADAWLQLASESRGDRGAYSLMSSGAFSRENECDVGSHQPANRRPNGQRRPLMSRAI